MTLDYGESVLAFFGERVTKLTNILCDLEILTQK